jgi:hypothetical protein
VANYHYQDWLYQFMRSECEARLTEHEASLPGLRGQVLATLRLAQRPMSTFELRTVLGLTDPAGIDRLRNALNRLAGQGRVRKIGTAHNSCGAPGGVWAPADTSGINE